MVSPSFFKNFMGEDKSSPNPLLFNLQSIEDGEIVINEDELDD